MVGAVFKYHTTVLPDWVDYNGHMGDYAYGIVFSDTATAYMDKIGIDAAYREKSSATLYTLDSRIGYLRECHSGEKLQIELSCIDADHKRIHVFMRMLNECEQVLAFCEQLLMHISRTDGTPRACDMPLTIQEHVFADRHLSDFLEKPDWLAGRIGLKKQT